MLKWILIGVGGYFLYKHFASPAGAATTVQTAAWQTKIAALYQITPVQVSIVMTNPATNTYVATIPTGAITFVGTDAGLDAALAAAASAVPTQGW